MVEILNRLADMRRYYEDSLLTAIMPTRWTHVGALQAIDLIGAEIFKLKWTEDLKNDPPTS